MTAPIAFTTELDDALRGFAETFGDSYLADDIARSLTCLEVEALAGVLRALGDERAAQTWIEFHGSGDDCGDSHCQCDECGKA